MRPTAPNHGALEMHFEHSPSGPTLLRHLYRKAPTIVQQALYFDEQLPHLPCVYILSSGGPNIEGDRYSVEVELADGAMAHISTGAATQIGTMERGEVETKQRFRLGQRAYLEWMPKELIPCSGARYNSTTEITIHPSAALFYSEVVACGRLHSGECFDYESLSLSVQLATTSGRVFAREAVRLEPQFRPPSEWALMCNFTHFATAIIVAPNEITTQLYSQILPISECNLRLSVARMVDGRGLIVRFLGQSSQQLSAELRKVCSRLRIAVKGVPLPDEFAWR